MSEEKKTTDHKAIQSFAEEHNLKPAAVKDNDELIRLMQPQSSASESDNLKEISWNDWFEAFEKNNLALVYGAGNSFNKLVSRN